MTVEISRVESAEVGRQLGYDLFRFGRQSDNGNLAQSVVEGYAQARARGIDRESPDRFTRKWLQLRMSAFERARAFDVAVTPELLRRIDVDVCPIMRIRLTHGSMQDSDWSVDRINNDGAYALHNLAVISTRANVAKGSRSFDEVYELARGVRCEAGLAPEHWLRLASVMLGPCFVDKPDSIPIIPLAAPIPMFTARFVGQIIQQLITLEAKKASGKNVLIKRFARACNDERSLWRLKFMIETIHVGLKGLDYPWDVWLKPRVMAAFVDWHRSLTLAGCAAAAAIAYDSAPVERVSMKGLQTWSLDAHGYAKY
ncbi:MAG: hypothetical protein V4582_20345 [Pseudomonadota bacterium]